MQPAKGGGSARAAAGAGAAEGGVAHLLLAELLLHVPPQHVVQLLVLVPLHKLLDGLEQVRDG